MTGAARPPPDSGRHPPIPSVNRIFRLTSALVAGLTVIVLVITVFVAARALYRWELQTIDAVLVGVNGPAKLAIEYLDRTQAQNVTDGLLNSPGIFYASLRDDFGDEMALSQRPPPPTSWVIDLLQAIWGESTHEMTRAIEVSSGRRGELSVDVMLGETTGSLIQTSLLAILLQAALVIVLVWASIYWAAALPLVSGLRTLSGWIGRSSREELVPLPPPESFRFSEIHDSGLFIHSIIRDLLAQRRDLARTVGRLEEQITLNEQYIGIIEQILFLTNKTALHISPAGHLTWYNRNEPFLGFLGDIATGKFDFGLRALADRLEALPEVRRVTRRATRRTAPDGHGHNLFDIDVELKNGRILELIGIDLGDGGQALMISDETQARAFAQDMFQKQKLESLGVLTSGVAHDMNNILAILAGTIELELTGSPAPQTERNLTMALAAVDQGRSVVRTLLTFSRKTRAEVSIESATGILHDLQVILKGKIGGEIGVTCRIEARDAHVSVDRPRLTNALLNLAINARDAIGERGHIGLTLRNAAAEDDLPAGATDSRDFVIFAVEDDGPGIPEHLRQSIMDPFFTTKSADKGTGLGLTLAYNVAEEFGGKLSFRSEPGHGACFMIALPRAAAGSRVRDAGGRTSRNVAREPGRTLLLVDDEPRLGEIARSYLEGRGYRVTIAASVAGAARELRKAGAFDIVVTDLGLGDGTGTEIARMVRAGEHDSTVILISGNMDYGVPDGTGELFDGSLEKPFAWSELDKLIQGLSASDAAARARRRGAGSRQVPSDDPPSGPEDLPDS
ncbi:ATP-binding protein [Tropicimonas sp.]|uniref:ATP-binding protein n=1 Tax=Tropicimonas sp. TaxID=2067044 RepID=UPI003A8B20C6